MPKEFNRSQRVADYLQRELAQLIQQELRDPRLGLVSVNAVDVSRDMAHAKVYVTFLSRDEQSGAEHDELIEVLNKAAGYLRKLIAAGMNMRTTPRLQFVFDSSIDRGSYLSSLIDEAVAADKKLQQDGDE